MDFYNRFKRKMELKGGSLRNENVRNSRLLVEEVFKDDASLTDNIYFWKLGLTDYSDEEPLTIRMYNRRFSNANGVMTNFQTLMDIPVVTGDVIYDSVNDEYMICTESFNENNIYYSGKFTLCTWILKWQKKDGTILEYPCIDMNATQYNSGETSNRNFTIGTSQHMITLPYDENTVALRTPQRFILDRNTEYPSVFIVTQNDTTSYAYGKKGLVKVTLAEHVLNTELDRADLGICDYIDVDDVTTDNSEDSLISKSVIYFDTRVIKSGGDSQVFTGKFYDSDGHEVTDVAVKWEIICDFVDALNVVESGNQISISIDNDDYIDEELKLVLSDANGDYSSSLLITIQSLL